ncbi:MAG: HNH endonuclease [Deltaproteobacteria bacterium]|nr:HNH endonuclease [Deltaproteobacteria bacterium]
MADKRGEVYEHRLVMAEKLGRPLESYEHVHHLDGDKTNNRADNLKLIEPQAHNIMTKLIAENKRLKAKIERLQTLLD